MTAGSSRRPSNIQILSWCWVAAAVNVVVGDYFPPENLPMDGDRYIEMLKDYMLTFLTIDAYNFFMHDSAYHRAKKVTKFFLEYNVQMLGWPNSSPNFNPMENCWAYRNRKLRQCDTLVSLHLQTQHSRTSAVCELLILLLFFFLVKYKKACFSHLNCTLSEKPAIAFYWLLAKVRPLWQLPVSDLLLFSEMAHKCPEDELIWILVWKLEHPEHCYWQASWCKSVSGKAQKLKRNL